jgi:hypothetical protein
MGKLTKQLLCVSVLVIMALALGARPALASDVDPVDASGFGAIFSPATTTAFGAGQWTATLTETVYQCTGGPCAFAGDGVYTYVFTVANLPASLVSLSQFTTATLGVPNVDNFVSSLFFGVITGPAFTTPGVDDGSGGCTAGGFCFGNFSLTVAPTSLTDAGHLPSGDQITFYAQGHAPTLGTFGAQNGGTNSSIPSLDPLPTPEPRSILLFGTGLLMFGVILRRRLPQLTQPL